MTLSATFTKRLVGGSLLLLMMIMMVLARERPGVDYQHTEERSVGEAMTGKALAYLREGDFDEPDGKIFKDEDNTTDEAKPKPTTKTIQTIADSTSSTKKTSTDSTSSTTKPSTDSTSSTKKTSTDSTSSTKNPSTNSTPSTNETSSDSTPSTNETSTDSTPSTNETTTITITTSEATTSETTTEPTTGVTDPQGSTEPPLSGLDLYKETSAELQLISEVLDKFTVLVNTEDDAASPRRVRRGLGLPAAWWLRGEAADPRESSYSFCVEGVADDSPCRTLEGQLEKTDNLIADLRKDVDDWKDSDLTQLRQQRQGLDETYEEANDDPKTFKESVETEKFTEAIGDVKQNVQDANDNVKNKIDEIDPPSNPGSVALVAVMGSVGGLMVVGVVGAMVYGAVKKPKSKKKPSSAAPGKAKNENIPIDAFAQDGPGSRPASRVDPYRQEPQYRQEPAPVPRRNQYSAQYDARREPVYPERQKGLRRTNF